MESGELRVTNRNHHTDLSQYRCLWTLSIDGKQKDQGEITLPEVAPGESETIPLPVSIAGKKASAKATSDLRLTISFILKLDALWAKPGMKWHGSSSAFRKAHYCLPNLRIEGD